MKNLLQMEMLETVAPLGIMISAPIIIFLLLWYIYGKGSIAGSSILSIITFFRKTCLGSTYSWTVVMIFMLFAYVFLLHSPSVLEHSPSVLEHSPREHSPREHGKTYETIEFKANNTIYYNNGLTYFFVTIFLFGLILFASPENSNRLYNNVPYIISTFNIIAICLCFYLYYISNHKTDNSVKDFYAGTENHVRIADVDVKQLVNCRIAMMSWALFILLFLYIGSVDKDIGGLSNASIASAIIQLVYIAKFFYWETGYFNTIDIMHDMCGFYILWGCLVFLPVIYTLTSAYLCKNQIEMSFKNMCVIVFIGILFISLNYYSDYEKEKFKKENGDETNGDEKNGTYLDVISRIEDENGKIIEKNSKLLTSGTWGIARHLNYTFEILSALSWSVPSGLTSPIPYIYVIYLSVLLLHRTYRDEIRCSKKYGEYWDMYKKIVPDLLIPGDRMISIF
jgi:7-dehydrocholesterol reductase